jgi:hypothetical protein
VERGKVPRLRARGETTGTGVTELAACGLVWQETDVTSSDVSVGTGGGGVVVRVTKFVDWAGNEMHLFSVTPRNTDTGE